MFSKQLSGVKKRQLKKAEEAKAAKLPKIVDFLQQNNALAISPSSSRSGTAVVAGENGRGAGDNEDVMSTEQSLVKVDNFSNNESDRKLLPWLMMLLLCLMLPSTM